VFLYSKLKAQKRRRKLLGPCKTKIYLTFFLVRFEYDGNDGSGLPLAQSHVMEDDFAEEIINIPCWDNDDDDDERREREEKKLKIRL